MPTNCKTLQNLTKCLSDKPLGKLLKPREASSISRLSKSSKKKEEEHPEGRRLKSLRCTHYGRERAQGEHGVGGGSKVDAGWAGKHYLH